MTSKYNYLLLLFVFLGITGSYGQEQNKAGVYRTIDSVEGSAFRITLFLEVQKADGITRIREMLPENSILISFDAPGALVEHHNNALTFLWVNSLQKPRSISYTLSTNGKSATSIVGDFTLQNNSVLYQNVIATENTVRNQDKEFIQTFQFKGKTTNSNGDIRTDVRVTNLNGPYLAQSNVQGEFSITAHIGDTLQLSSPNIHSLNYVINSSDYAQLREIRLIDLTEMRAIPVEVKANARGEFRFYRNGIEYFVKGGGGSEQWDELARIGGNSVRTWSTDNAKEMLDKAHSLGLTVMMGLWMQHERHGFDYDDKPKVQAQLEYFRKIVLEVKDHPALLLWGIGNEVDLFYTNTNVWKAVNDVAKMIHELDPNHPTSTVTAGLDPAEVKLIMQDAPEIDVYCVNTYGDIANVRKNIASYGWTGPYMITEWGPNGHWEVAKTRWGAPIEQSSAEKAVSYKERYENEILAASKNCMGSYVFLWGFKQETTSTWYGLFTREGLRSEPIDELEKFWSGKAPANIAPHLTSLMIDEKNAAQSIMLTAEKKYSAIAAVTDGDGDKLNGRWLIVPESTDIKAGGDAESAPTPISGLFKDKSAEQATFRAPRTEGAYRLFYEVTDGHGHCAYGNVPFYVVPAGAGEEPARMVRFKQQEMQ